MPSRTTSAAGVALIQQFEGCKLTAYLCPAGVWTIGYGSTGPHVTPGLTITNAKIERPKREEFRALLWQI